MGSSSCLLMLGTITKYIETLLVEGKKCNKIRKNLKNGVIVKYEINNDRMSIQLSMSSAITY